MRIYYKKKFWAGVGALLLGLALPGTCLFVGWERFDLKDAVLTTFMVLSGIRLAGCFIGWWRSGEQEVYIQTAVPCMVLFIVGWITRIASDFYYEFKG